MQEKGREGRMSGLGWNEKSNTGQAGGRDGGPHTASASFRECDFNESLIKSEAVPIIHTLLQRCLSPHTLLPLRGSASGGDCGPTSTAGKGEGNLTPSCRWSGLVRGLPDVPIWFPPDCA